MRRRCARSGWPTIRAISARTPIFTGSRAAWIFSIWTTPRPSSSMPSRCGGSSGGSSRRGAIRPFAPSWWGCTSHCPTASRAGKHVYVVAAHDHFYVAGAMNTDYWRAQGGPLEAWIICTAGAVRYRLPADASRAREARTNVYGYLLATVQPDGQIAFVFRPIEESAVPAATRATFGPAFVHWCFAENTVAR